MRKLLTLSALAAAMLIFVGCEIDEPRIEINADDDPGVTQPAQTVTDNTFLWKPASETRGGRAAVLLPGNLTATTITVNGEYPAEIAGRSNGNRQTYFLRQPGAAYGASVRVVAVGTGRAWTVPDGAGRWGSQ